MTEKVQKLSKQLTSEKAASEELQKSTSVQMSQQTSENRKLLLEISKLKVRLNVCTHMYKLHKLYITTLVCSLQQLCSF